MFRTGQHEAGAFLRPESPQNFMADVERNLPQDEEAYTKLLVMKATMSGDVDQLMDIIGRSSKPSELVNSQDLSGCTALHVAARFNQVKVAEILLSYGADCNKIAWSTVSPLQVACRYQHEKMVQLLLKYKSDPLQKLSGDGNVLHAISLYSTVQIAELVFGGHIKPPVKKLDGMGMTSLHKAAQAGNSGMCLWLLRHGAYPMALDVRRMTPFMLACRLGHTDVMATLLLSDTHDAQVKSRMISEVDVEGMTSLHHAILGGRFEAVQALLIWGANPNVVDVHGMSPLHLCVAEGDAQLISLLGSHKANFSLQDSKGRTPLHMAVELKCKEIVHSLLKQGSNPNIPDKFQRTPLLLACRTGYLEAVDLFCEYGADTEATNLYGQTCLHVAIEGGHLEVVLLLLERCSQKCPLLRTKDLFGQTVTHEAAKHMDHQFVEVLLGQGCSAEIEDLAGLLPLHVASCCGGYQTVLKLAEVAPDINVKSPDGKTALYLAAEFGNSDALAALLKMGADVKIVETNFKNSLMAAAIGGFTDIVNDLIDKGMQINSKDKEHNTALHHACLHGRLATVKTLLDHGACVSNVNILGQTPLAMAVEKSKSEVAGMLMEHSSWEESLSVHSQKGYHVINQMIENTPSAVQIILDKCVKTSDHPKTHEEYAIEFNYKYVNSPTCIKSASECVFVKMLKCGREELLSHPLCQSNFSYKWHLFGKASFLFQALIQAGILLSLTAFYCIMPRPHDARYRCNVTPPQLANQTNDTEFGGNSSDWDNATEVNNWQGASGRPKMSHSYMAIITYILLFFNALQVFKELYTCLVVGFKYLISMRFILQTVICVLVTLASVPPGYEPCDGEWKLFAYASFIFFVKTSFTCQRLDGIGLFFTMFIEVAKTIIKISFLMLFFIPAVAIPLSIMVNEPGFLSQGHSLMSTFALALGELNYRDTFVLTDNQPFSLDLYWLFPIFCLLLNCSLMNLMIGVAVGDISKVEKSAYMSRLKAHIYYLIETEQMLSSKGRHKLIKEKLVVRPNSKCKNFNEKIKRKLLYCEQINFIKKDPEASSLTEQELVMVKELENQKATLDKLTKATDEIMDLLQKINYKGCQTRAENTPTPRPSRSLHADDVSSFVKEAQAN